ncbi:MAG: hypothetical protein ABI557_08700, partial [Aureliella sp.]
MSDCSPQVVDSDAFRGKLQQQVARLIGAVDIRQLLPWQTIQRPIAFGLGACAALLLLCMVPNLHLSQRMARILLPMFDWGRVGRIVISLERPMPHSKTFPRDDIVAITARTVGPPPSSLQLETRVADGEIQTIEMQPLETNTRRAEPSLFGSTARFEALLPANAVLVDYRVVGEGASTPWYRLTTVPRPQVIEFEKRITPPTYDSTEPDNLATTHIETHGNLRVLKGSRVKLLLTVDQPLRSAELRWVAAPSSAPSDSADTPTIAASATQEDPNAQNELQVLLWAPDSQRYVTELLAEHSASYKIHLQSLDGGITNEFSPTYELQVVDDRAPTVRWLQPLASSLIATSNQILPFQHEIVDELPLVSITRWVRVNGSGAWQSVHATPLSKNDASEFDAGKFTVTQPTSLVAPRRSKQDEAGSASGDLLQRISRTQWAFDMLSQHTEPGDYLEVKLSATDLGGLVGESSVLRVDISSASPALDAQPPEVDRRNVAGRLSAVASKIAEAKQVFESSLPAQPADSQDKLNPTQAALLKRVAAELQTEIAETMAAVEQTAAETNDVLNSQALLRTGEILATWRTATSEFWDENTEQPATIDQQKWEQTLSQTHQKLEEESNQANELARQFESLSTYDALSRHARQIARLAEAEHLLHSAAEDDKQTPEQLKRRQKVLVEQLKTAQQAMLDSLPQLRQESRQPLQNSVNQLGQQIESIERFDKFEDRRALQDMTRSSADQLGRLVLVSQLDGSLPNAVKNADRRLAEMSPTTSAPLLTLAEQLDKDQATEKQATDKQTQYSLSQLSVRRDLQRAAAEGDREYAADLGNTQRAVEQLRADTGLGNKQQSQSIGEIAGAVVTLQAIHHVEQLQRLMRELLQNERWDEKPSELASHAPRMLDALESRYEQATNALRTAKIPDEIVQSINQTRWSPAAQRASQRIVHRLWNSEAPTSAAADVEQLLEQLNATREKLEEHALTARLKLQQHAPTISQLAERAAQRVEMVKEQTEQL